MMFVVCEIAIDELCCDFSKPLSHQLGVLIAPMLTAEGTLIVLGDFAWLTRAMAAAGLLSVAVIAGATKLGFGSVRTYWYATLLFTVLVLLLSRFPISLYNAMRARERWTRAASASEKQSDMRCLVN